MLLTLKSGIFINDVRIFFDLFLDVFSVSFNNDFVQGKREPFGYFGTYFKGISSFTPIETANDIQKDLIVKRMIPKGKKNLIFFRKPYLRPTQRSLWIPLLP